ncbi:MAG TPA: hypothetical protein PLD54_01080, partial [Candidatus Levybacteria bacterium]|nr:hypothetical protein [Candidatus Levybacteria bacterium]
MFGNLFNQKNNTDDQNAQGAVPQQPQVVQTGQTEQTTTSFGIQAGVPIVPGTIIQTVPVVTQTDTVTNVQTVPQPPPVGTVPVAPPTVTPDPTQPGVNPDTQPASMDPSKRENVSALSRLDARAAQVLHHAQEETKRVQQALIEPDQVLYGLI